MSLGLPILIIGADTHSGATVSDFNRVPVWLSDKYILSDLQLDYYLVKDQPPSFYQTASRPSTKK